MALWFSLGLDGYGKVHLIELTRKIIIKRNADIVDLNRIRKKYGQKCKAFKKHSNYI